MKHNDLNEKPSEQLSAGRLDSIWGTTIFRKRETCKQQENSQLPTYQR